MNEDEECVSLAVAARYLSVCQRTVRREIERGKIRAIRVGRSVRIRLSELRRYMAGQAIGVSV